MQDVNAMAAQGVAQRMGGGPPGAGGPPPGGPPGMQPGMGGPPGGGGNPAVEQGKQMLQQLTMLITSDPAVMMELAPDIQAFGNIIKQFASGGGQGGPQGPMPPPGPPGPGGPQGPPPGMG